jgi:anthranilate phosphoribosyltransferase
MLNNATTSMHQGAFLGALAAKGETENEIAGAWDAIYSLDTIKVKINPDLRPVENSGTGMDSFKTFNISTAAAIVAAAGGITMARHGARSITSACGTVDIAEKIGIDINCPANLVAKSIETANIGLFNGMSPEIHPGGLARILSQIRFGSVLNTAASLANPAMPPIGLRGVYSKEIMLPVLRVMKAVGYEKAMVVHGRIKDCNYQDASMDEASVCGPTLCAEALASGEINCFTIYPENFGMRTKNPDDLAPGPDPDTEARRFCALIADRENSLRKDAVLLNAGLIFYSAGVVQAIDHGIEKAAEALENGQALKTLEKWVTAQNRSPEKGLQILEKWLN